MQDSLPLFIQQVINGLSLGAIYALVAIGYTMVYGIIGMINFAHGEIYMIGAYVGFIVLTIIGVTFGLSGGIPIPLMLMIILFVSVIVTSLYGYTVERIAYRPLRKSPRLVALISAIGMSIFLQNWVALGKGPNDIPVPTLITSAFEFEMSNGFVITLPYDRLMVLGVTLLLMIVLSLYIKHSKMGRASRACSQDIQMANLLGIDTNKVISFTFILGAALAAVAGALITIVFGKLTPYIGFIYGIKAFTAAVLGGIGSIPGAVLGGIVLGLSETFAAQYIGSDYKDIVAFSLLILILLFKPAGLLGKPEVEKV